MIAEAALVIVFLTSDGKYESLDGYERIELSTMEECYYIADKMREDLISRLKESGRVSKKYVNYLMTCEPIVKE